MANDTLKVTGALHIVLTDAQGNIKDERNLKNLVVTGGKQWVAKRFLPTTYVAPIPAQPADVSTMQVGTGSTTPAAADTALGTQVLNASASLNTGYPTVAFSAVTYSATFAAGVGTGSLTEAGLFAGSTMISRLVFGTITKNAADILSFDWIITIG